MKRFISLTTSRGWVLLVSCDHIVSVRQQAKEDDGASLVTLVNGTAAVKETIAEIIKLAEMEA